jgi:hypothetical protein
MLDGISDTVTGGLIAITSSLLTLIGAVFVDTIRSRRDRNIKRYEVLYSPSISKLEAINDVFVRLGILYEQRAGYDPHVGPYNDEGARLYNDYGLVYGQFEILCKDLSEIISRNIHLSRAVDWKYFKATRQTMDRIHFETALDGNKKFNISVVVKGKELMSHLEEIKRISRRFDN